MGLITVFLYVYRMYFVSLHKLLSSPPFLLISLFFLSGVFLFLIHVILQIEVGWTYRALLLTRIYWQMVIVGARVTTDYNYPTHALLWPCVRGTVSPQACNNF